MHLITKLFCCKFERIPGIASILCEAQFLRSTDLSAQQSVISAITISANPLIIKTRTCRSPACKIVVYYAGVQWRLLKLSEVARILYFIDDSIKGIKDSDV